MSGPTRPIIEVRDLHKAYDNQVVALGSVSLAIWPGESVAIVGRSGSGKSTLLGILGLLDEPTTGEILIDGEPVDFRRDRLRARRRALDFGFVFQRSHLLPELTARENVDLSLRYAGWPESRMGTRSTEALSSVDLAHRTDAQARTLSGGEMQRVAVARTMARRARVWLADEPTGNLDSAQSIEVIDLLLRRAAEHGAALVVVTHEPDIAARMSRVVTIQDGAVTSDTGGAPSTAPPEETAGPAPAGRTRVARRTARFVLQTLRAQPRRSASGIAAAALAVALTITAIGLGQSASAQVTDLFDSRRAQQVSAGFTYVLPPGDLTADRSDTVRAAPLEVEQLRSFPGVRHAELWHLWESVPMENGGVAATTAQVAAPEGDPFAASGTDVTWSDTDEHLGDGEVVLGVRLAQRLQVRQIDLQPEVAIAGDLYRVVGIATGSEIGTAPGAAFVSGDAGPGLAPASSGVIYVDTVPGGARGVADRLPALVDPYARAKVDVAPVLRPDAYRAELEDDVSASLAVLSFVAVLAGLIGVAAVNILSVGSRRAELGVRRAFGARRSELVALVIGESTLVSLIGSLFGISLGFSVIMVVTAVGRWHPVFDQRLILVGMAGAALFGIVGGIAPAIAAGRVEPAEAVRA